MVYLNIPRYTKLGKVVTTIKLSKGTVELLSELKVHPRQSYEEVILELLKRKKKND